MRVGFDAERAPLVAARAAVNSLRRTNRRAISTTKRQRLIHCCAQQQWADHRRAAFKLAQVDARAFAARLPFVHGLQNSEAGVKAANVIVPGILDRGRWI